MYVYVLSHETSQHAQISIIHNSHYSDLDFSSFNWYHNDYNGLR